MAIALLHFVTAFLSYFGHHTAPMVTCPNMVAPLCG